MRITIENTSKVIDVRAGAERTAVPARIWEGETASGVPVAAFITRIVCLDNDRSAEFDAELQEVRAPRPDLEAIPARLVL